MMKRSVRTLNPLQKRFITASLVGGSVIQGGTINQSVDLASVRIGEILEYPYEYTYTQDWRTKWQSSFFQQDRINTSLPYCRKMNLKDIPIPYDLCLFHASSMTHVEDTRDVWELRLTDAHLHRAIFPGDTITKLFQIKDVRDTADGKNIIVDISCKLQANGKTAFSVTKTMMYTKLQKQKKVIKINFIRVHLPMKKNHRITLLKIT
eukprot:UN31448